MSQELTLFQGSQLSANVSSLFAAKSNIAEQGEKVPQLTYQGKVWTIHSKGVEKQLLDDEENPRPSVEVVILGSAPRRARIFYEGKFEAGKNIAPKCHSFDGIVPASDVREPVSDKCSDCPNAVKGSKTTESGKATFACSFYHYTAVVPAGDPSFEALRLRLSSTSLWAPPETVGEDEAKGWYLYDSYLKMLKARGVSHTASVVTKIRFDPKQAHPQLLFKAERHVTEEEAKVIIARLDNPDIDKLLFGKDGKPSAQAQLAAGAAQKPQEVKKVAEEPSVDLPEPEDIKVDAFASKHEKVEEPAPKAEKPKAVKKAPDPVVETNADLESALSDWD